MAYGRVVGETGVEGVIILGLKQVLSNLGWKRSKETFIPNEVLCRDRLFYIHLQEPTPKVFSRNFPLSPTHRHVLRSRPENGIREKREGRTLDLRYDLHVVGETLVSTDTPNFPIFSRTHKYLTTPMEGSELVRWRSTEQFSLCLWRINPFGDNKPKRLYTSVYVKDQFYLCVDTVLHQ